MKYRVTGKQPNSKMCLVCGLRNPYGLKAFFYELENDVLVAVFTPQQEHQGYPGRLHGGIATAILDETIGRAILTKGDAEIWGVTAKFNVRFRKPVPLVEDVRVVGRILTETRRHFEGSGEILLPDGTIAVEATGTYLKYDIDAISDWDVDEQEWRVCDSGTDPTEFELPGRRVPDP